MERLDVSFESGGLQCGAWLYLPETDDSGPSPCVVLGHGFGCVKRLRLDAFARRFCDAGLTALAFDYRHFGDSEGQPRQLIDIERQLEDWRAGVAFARGLVTVDRHRVALWGTSLGGGHVVAIAATDPEIAAVVSQIPFTGGVGVARNTGLVHSLRLTVAGLRDELRARRGRDPRYIPLYGPPATLAAMPTSGMLERVEALTEGRVDNRYAPRVGCRLGGYTPYRELDRVGCPVLVCTSRNGASWSAVAEMSRVTVRDYPVGPFEIYDGAAFERAVNDQRDFLARHLLHADSEAPSAAPKRGSAR